MEFWYNVLSKLLLILSMAEADPERRSIALYQTVFILLVSLNLVRSSSNASSDDVVESAVIECPCSFFVVSSNNLSTLSFSIVPPSATRPSKSSNAVRRSLPRSTYTVASLHHGWFHNSQTNSYRIAVERAGRFSLIVKTSSETSLARRSAPAQIVRLHTRERQQNETCPTVLTQHAPKGEELSDRKARPGLHTRLDGSEHSPQRKPLSRITGGLESTPDLAKYMVLFASPLSVTNDSYVQCTGTLISPDLVVTAAHCVYDNQTVTLSSRVLISGTRLSPLDGIESSILSINFHPLYNTLLPDESFYDFAWVRLTSPAPDTAGFMKFNVNQSIPIPTSFVRIAGYGHLLDFNQNPNPNGVLYQVDVPVVDPEQCATLYDTSTIGIAINSSQQMCAGYVERSGCGIW